jgi:hypothetical protein
MITQEKTATGVYGSSYKTIRIKLVATSPNTPTKSPQVSIGEPLLNGSIHDLGPHGFHHIPI